MVASLKVDGDVVGVCPVDGIGVLINLLINLSYCEFNQWVVLKSNFSHRWFLSSDSQPGILEFSIFWSLGCSYLHHLAFAKWESYLSVVLYTLHCVDVLCKNLKIIRVLSSHQVAHRSMVQLVFTRLRWIAWLAGVLIVARGSS